MSRNEYDSLPCREGCLVRGQKGGIWRKGDVFLLALAKLLRVQRESRSVSERVSFSYPFFLVAMNPSFKQLHEKIGLWGATLNFKRYTALPNHLCLADVRIMCVNKEKKGVAQTSFLQRLLCLTLYSIIPSKASETVAQTP